MLLFELRKTFVLVTMVIEIVLNDVCHNFASVT